MYGTGQRSNPLPARRSMADTKPNTDTVFQSMTRHRPKLARFLATDDDEEPLDIRELADQVAKGFPHPISVELRRLFSSEKHPPRPLPARSAPQDHRADPAIHRLRPLLPTPGGRRRPRPHRHPCQPQAAPVCERLLKPGWGHGLGRERR